MFVGEQWSGPNLGRNLRVLLAFVYAVCVCALAVLVLNPPAIAALLTLAGACWLTMLVLLVVRVARARAPWLALRAQVATLLLLATPVPFLAPIDNVYSILLLLAAFVLVVRRITAGDSLRFAAVTVVGIVLLSAVGMSMAESREPTGTIDTFGDSLLWAAAEVLRLGNLVELDPVTHNGRILGAVVIFSGVLLAAIVFAGITSWLVDERDQAGEAEDAGEVERLVDRAVRTALAQAFGPDVADALALPGDDAAEPAEGTVRIWLDTDRIVGSARRAWRRDRADAVAGLVSALGRTDPNGPPWTDLPLAGRRPRPVAVLQGGALRRREPLAAAAADPALPLHVDSRPAPDGARPLIAAEARPGDIVVTSDTHLRDLLAHEDVTVADIAPFLALLPPRDGEEAGQDRTRP